MKNNRIGQVWDNHGIIFLVVDTKEYIHEVFVLQNYLSHDPPEPKTLSATELPLDEWECRMKRLL